MTGSVLGERVLRKEDPKFLTTGGVYLDDLDHPMLEGAAHVVFARSPIAHGTIVSIDIDGVGELIKLGAERGRETRPGIKLGICGEHGGDPASVHFCADIGLDYVSCSPYRVPIARLAAAQAALRRKG